MSGALERLVLGEGEEAALGKLVHVFLVVLEEGRALAFEADLFTIDERVVGTRLGEELDDDGDCVDEHEEECEDRVRGERESPAFVSTRAVYRMRERSHGETAQLRKSLSTKSSCNN
jgi:hypothetical protein